jgi:hypothetical protein
MPPVSQKGKKQFVLSSPSIRPFLPHNRLELSRHRATETRSSGLKTCPIFLVAGTSSHLFTHRRQDNLAPRVTSAPGWRPLADGGHPHLPHPQSLGFLSPLILSFSGSPEWILELWGTRTWFPWSWFVHEFRKGFRIYSSTFPSISRSGSMRFGEPGTWFLRSYLFMNFGLDLHWYKPEIFGRILWRVFIPAVVLSDGEIVRLVQVFVQNVWCVADYMCLWMTPD